MIVCTDVSNITITSVDKFLKTFVDCNLCRSWLGTFELCLAGFREAQKCDALLKCPLGDIVKMVVADKVAFDEACVFHLLLWVVLR